MGCCGGQRQKYYHQSAAPRRNPPQSPPAHNNPQEGNNKILFQYVGRTSMTVITPVTRTRYRFEEPGAILPVDPRDRASLANVPNLKQVK